MVVPVGASCFAQALAMSPRFTARRRGDGRGRQAWPAWLTKVATGDVRDNEEALDYLVRAIERAGLRPGEDMAISLDIAASEFGRDGRYALASRDREFDTAA